MAVKKSEPEETTKENRESLEVITAKSVVALFYASEQLCKARDPEQAVKLAKMRAELETAIGGAS